MKLRDFQYRYLNRIVTIDFNQMSNSKLFFMRHYLRLVARKPVFGVSDKTRLKPVSSATETRYNSEISLVASLDMILFNKRITKALIRKRGCAGWSAHFCSQTPEDRFSRVEAQFCFGSVYMCNSFRQNLEIFLKQVASIYQFPK